MRTHSNLHWAALVVTLLSVSCKKKAENAELAQPKQSAPSAPAPSAAQVTSTVEPVSSAPPAEEETFEPVTHASITALTHRIIEDSLVRVDLHPFCSPQQQPEGGTSPVEREEWPGLTSSDDASLRDQVSQRSAFVGLVLDASRKTLVLVFEPDFTAWDTIQKTLRLSGSTPVELRPGCHTREQRRRALALLGTFKALNPPLVHGWTEEPSVAGFRVFILPGDLKARAQVVAQLGSIANVWFSRPFGEH